MKLNLKTILIIVLLFISTVVIIWGIRKNNQVKAEKAKYRTEKIKADKLQKVVTEKGVQYEKLVADTVGTGQLRRIIKELGIDIKNPQLAQEIIFVPRDTITIIKEIEATDSTLVFTDYYPQKENYFAKHITRQDTRDTTATGEFSFNPIKLSLAIGQQDDGTYKVATKLPEFFNITSIDVQSLPMKEEKDDWGILVGADYIKNLQTDRVDLGVDTYIRFKKFYIGGGVNTNMDLKGGVKFEF